MCKRDPTRLNTNSGRHRSCEACYFQRKSQGLISSSQMTQASTQMSSESIQVPLSPPALPKITNRRRGNTSSVNVNISAANSSQEAALLSESLAASAAARNAQQQAQQEQAIGKALKVGAVLPAKKPKKEKAATKPEPAVATICWTAWADGKSGKSASVLVFPGEGLGGYAKDYDAGTTIAAAFAEFLPADLCRHAHAA